MTSSFISNSALCSSDDDDSVGSAGIMKGDVYCCPVCYTVARRSMLDKRKSHDDYSNPLDVLSDKGLQVSALFCFNKLTSVKDHIRTAHGLDLSTMEGNDLFHRFQVSRFVLPFLKQYLNVPLIQKIRASDGLVQQWTAYKRYQTIKGFWTNKNICLYSQLNQHISRQKYGDAPRSPLSASLTPKLELDIWKDLIKPYLKSTNNEIIDNGVVEEDLKPMPNVDPLVNPEEGIISFCRQAYKCNNDERLYEEDDSDTSFDEDNDGPQGGESDEHHEEIILEDDEDDKDDWLTQRLKRPTATRKASLFQRYLQYDSDSDASSPSSSLRKENKRMKIHDDSSYE